MRPSSWLYVLFLSVALVPALRWARDEPTFGPRRIGAVMIATAVAAIATEIVAWRRRRRAAARERAVADVFR